MADGLSEVSKEQEANHSGKNTPPPEYTEQPGYPTTLPGYPGSEYPVTQPGYTTNQPGYTTNQPGYPTTQPGYPSSPPINPGYWQPYPNAPHGYSSLPVASGATADDVMLIPGVTDNRVVLIRERETFTKQIILSCFVFWVCCWPLGLAAFALAMMADSRSKQPDEQSAAEAHKLGVHSTRTSISGIIFGVIIICALIVYIVVEGQHRHSPR